MSLELKIKFDGSSEDLAAHRLSISRFGESLQLLLKALRRTASTIISEAVSDGSQAQKGRYAKQAKKIDLQVTSLSEGSLIIEFNARSVPTLGDQTSFFGELADQALLKTIKAIDAESRGEIVNHSARKYLASLPDDLTSQSYDVYRDGKSLLSVQIGETNLAEFPPEAPGLSIVVGEIYAIGFVPPCVTINCDGRTIKAAATDEQVETAISLRDKVSVAVLFKGGQYRILWIRPGSNPLPILSGDERLERINKRWPETLKALAQ